MPISRKKVVAKIKVAEKGAAKKSLAKKALKKAAYGVGIIVRKVSKVGKVASPQTWKDAKQNILAALKLPKKPAAKAEVPVIAAKSKRTRTKSKRTAVKAVTPPEPLVITTIQPEII